MPKALAKTVAKAPSAKLQDAKDLHAEVLDEKQIELKLETQTVAI